MLPRTPSSSPTPPPVQVAPSRDFKPGLLTKVPMATEWIEALRGPGDALNLNSGKKFRMIRDQLDAKVPYAGINFLPDGSVQAHNVPNPDSTDGSWNPTDWMPRFAFDDKEDAFPVSPTFDGDMDYNNNGPETHDGKGSYQDGSIGGRQPLSGAFTVTRKGDYHILTYNFYYAHNKAMEYHKNDYSTAQIYLKPGPDGKLQPTHMATSWHHGSVLTPWKDLEKDADGRPIVKVHLGSHALQPIGKGDDWDQDGLNITGKGDAVFNGKPIGQTIGFEAFQTNVRGATYLDPKSPTAKPRLATLQWGDAAKNPFLPEVYADAEHPVVEAAKRFLGPVVKKVVDTGKSLLSKIGGIFS